MSAKVGMLLELSFGVRGKTKHRNTFSWCKLPQLHSQRSPSSREVLKLLLVVLNAARYSAGLRPCFGCEALWEAQVRGAGVAGVEDTGQTFGEEKGPLQEWSQIKRERVKGDCVKMRLLQEGDERNRREIEESLNLSGNQFSF